MLALSTLLFATLSAKVAEALRWVAAIQIFPLALSAAFGTLVAWLLITLIFGRIYCSTVCPLGATMDIFNRLAGNGSLRRGKRLFHYENANNTLRYTVLGTVVLCAVLGVAVVPSLLDPYSAFGRIGSEMIRPLAELVGGEKVVIASWLAFAVATVTLVVVAWLSLRKGRILCNTICPVGTLLGCVSRYSLLHFDIDTDLCTHCRRCEHACKSSCISIDDHTVDGSRCVTCFRCVDVCPDNAIRYTTRHKRLATPLLQRIQTAAGTACATPGSTTCADASEPLSARKPSEPLRIDRRNFLKTGLIVALAPAVGFAAKASGEAASSRSLRPVIPPGRRNREEFLERCTGCGLCVSHCPSHALTPSVSRLGWLHPLHPIMDYDRGACLYDCTLCTRLCPTGALNPLTLDEKHIFIIGHAEVDENLCVGCGTCAAHCPYDAIVMIPGGKTGRIADVDTERCIGCGVCQNVCPVDPKAIAVDGII